MAQFIEVCYALKDQQYLVEVPYQKGLTIREVILLSKIIDQDKTLVLDKLSVGIFSKKKELNDLVFPNDRVEIYRPLTIDPMEARRIRAEKKRKDKKLTKFGA
ncbi:RnfH family protein [Thiotrichales bacterium 19S11-10]|nr:RnfH family protein [Thiotrichales bacterium 19S11-10]